MAGSTQDLSLLLFMIGFIVNNILQFQIHNTCKNSKGWYFPPFRPVAYCIGPTHKTSRLTEVPENSWMQSYLIVGLFGLTHPLPWVPYIRTQLRNKKLNDINDWYSEFKGDGLIRKSDSTATPSQYVSFVFLFLSKDTTVIPSLSTFYFIF